MRQFAQKGFRITQLSREAKVLYTFFCLLSLLALFSSVLYYEDLVGMGLGKVREYYAGESSATTESTAAQGRPGAEGEKGAAQGANGAAEDSNAGPEIELPQVEGDVAGNRGKEALGTAPIITAMPYRKLLEVSHFHLFTVPVFLLIVAHLFMLTPMAPATKLAWILSGCLSSLAHIIAPWLIRYGGARFAAAMPITGSWMFVSLLVLTGWPMLAMWRRDRA